MAIIDNFNDYNIYKDKDYSLLSNQVNDNGKISNSLENTYKDISVNLKIDHSKSRPIKRKGIIDWETTNSSFLDLYNDLYKLGIKNNKFFLKLYDTDLIKINPYQKNLPLELKIKIFVECVINPWYFLREVCRIPEDGTPIEVGGGTQYKIDRNNLASWYLLLNGIDVYKSKPRQCGKTQDALAFLNYSYHFGTLSTNMSFFNKKAEDAQMNLSRLKSQRDMLPEYLQMRVAFSEEGTIKENNNVKSMINPINKNKITCMPKATGKESAMSIGRGFTTALQHLDEFDFMPWNTEIVDASVFAYRTAHENAIKNKSLSARIFTSTPGDMDTRDGAAATEFVNKMLVWEDGYLDKDINELKKIIYSKSYNGVVFVEHSWKQLKKGIGWYEKSCQDVGYKQEVIAREIELKRIRGTSRSPFRPADLFFLSHNIKDFVDKVDYSKNLCPIIFYEELHKDYPYILAVDPAEGLSGDNTAMTLLNPYTLKVAAEFKSPYINQTDMSKLIVKFMSNYCPKAMIVVENNRGRELIHRLQDTKFRNRMWYDKDKLDRKIKEKTNEYGAHVYNSLIDQSLGFNTNGMTRNTLFSILEEEVNENKKNIISQFVIDDILGLERKPTGRIEAGDGSHDDNVMSWLIGLCVYYNASNLEEFGIIRGAKEPITFDPNDPEYVRNKVKKMLQYLPEELRSEFNQHEDKNSVTDSWEYYKEIEITNLNNKINDPSLMDKEEYEEFKDDENEIYQHMQSKLAQSDYYYNDHSNDIDIDDFI